MNGKLSEEKLVAFFYLQDEIVTFNHRYSYFILYFTNKTPSWEDWYNWGGTKKETSKADCEHQEKEIQTTRTYEYDDNWELTRCTEKAEGGKKTVHNYTYDKIGNRTSYEKIEDGVSKAKYNYKYNDSNQLIKRTNAKIWGEPGTTYSYDEDGNLIQE